MAQMHGVPGEWARVRGAVLSLWPLFVGVFACGFSLALMIVSLTWGLVLTVISLVFMSIMLRRGFRRIERFYVGARGEERVASILACLPGEYHVFNDFVACGSHIDHVVVGPAGIFAVETKFWRGRVTAEDGHILVDGRLPDRSPLSQVSREATLLKRHLAKLGWEGAVTPMLVFASDTFNAQPAEISGAIVINSSEINTSFQVRRFVLAADETRRIVSLMENNPR